MGEDDERECAACGQALQDHALSLREDGVIVAASISDMVGDWTECGSVETQRLRERLRIAEQALGTIVHHHDTGGACEVEGCRHISPGAVAEEALIHMSVAE
jgi:recombinational DNA repair protein (RecF pathway)